MPHNEQTIESIALSISLLMVIVATLSLIKSTPDPNVIAANSRCKTPISAHTGAICVIRGGVR